MLNFWYEFHERKGGIEKKIETEMRLCAYTGQCHGLQKIFPRVEQVQKAGILCRDGDFYSYFRVPEAHSELTKVIYPEDFYHKRLERLEDKTLRKFEIYSIVALLISLFFALYALMPIRRALHLNEEFVKDILHDFNTPISSMRINLKLLEKEYGRGKKIERLEHNIETIMLLQHNLQLFLKELPTQSEEFSLNTLLKARVSYFETLYPQVRYRIALKWEIAVKSSPDALVRIIDNLLSNAGKYNVEGGDVFVWFDGTHLIIKDTGKGIKRPSKVFNRYYKEQSRGIGIGLHIVKKLCDELGLSIAIESQLDKGTKVTLDLRKIITSP